jgi:hypothetical protein
MTKDTSDVVARLRERHTGQEVPSCSVCGEPLSIQAAGGGNATVYGCERHKPFDLDHYQRSRWTQYRPGDSDVLDVIDALAESERLLAEARALSEALNVTDAELVRINNMCVGHDGDVKIWAKMLHKLAVFALAARASIGGGNG